LTEVCYGGVFLPGHLGIVGLSLPAGLAGEVNTEIRRRELAVPIIAVSGDRTRWVFLVETPEGRFPALPVGVGVMGGATRIPLPPTVIGGELVRWVVEPGAGFVGVPRLAPILNAVRYFTSPRNV
jgi:hypothetical protein